jgi:hypothetical protein
MVVEMINRDGLVLRWDMLLLENIFIYYYHGDMDKAKG